MAKQPNAPKRPPARGRKGADDTVAQRPTGRPSSYSEAVAAEICRRLGEGESLRAICWTEGMPARQTVLAWVERDDGGFRDQYARAREAGYHVLAEQLLEIADDGSRDWIERTRPDGSVERVIDHEHVTRSRLRFDARRWYLAKMLPRQFGDRLQTDTQTLDSRGKPTDPARTLYNLVIIDG